MRPREVKPQGLGTMNNRPNILFLFTDQQRWDTVGCYGQELGTTPNLDEMAAQGVQFEMAFTCQPVCGPTRACLQTGKYATELGCHTNHRMLPPSEKTMAHWLSEAGYEVGYIGKWHLASSGPIGGSDDFRTRPVPPERRGGYRDFWLAADVIEFTSHSYDGHVFDGDMNTVPFPEGRFRVDCLTDFAIDYLRTRDRQRPFFLFLSISEPHQQNDHNQFEGPHGSKDRFRHFEAPGDLVGTDGDWRESYPDYLGCCHSIDANLGRIRRELESLGLAEDTLVIYASDHGCHFRTRTREYKRSCHDGSIRVPLIACGPGFRGGAVVRELVSLIDLPPTLLACAGLAPPPVMRGRPMQDLIERDAGDWPREVFVQISESQVGRAVRTHDWKYSVRAPHKHGRDDPGSDLYVEDFLYDLNADPHERHDLVTDPAYTAVRAELAATLKRRMRGAGEREPTIAPAAKP